LFDLSNKGTLIGAPKEDNNNIFEFDDSRKIQSWSLEGEKLVIYNHLCLKELKYFKNHYILMLMAPKLSEGKE
jgi:hypothetical protein